METETRMRWIARDTIFLLDGYGYGLNDNGQTVCVGSESEILKILGGEEGDATTRRAMARAGAIGVLGTDEGSTTEFAGARPTVHRRKQPDKAIQKRERSDLLGSNGKQPRSGQAR